MIETHGQEGMHPIWIFVVLYLLVSFTAAELMPLMLLLAMPLILILRVMPEVCGGNTHCCAGSIQYWTPQCAKSHSAI